MSKCSWHSSVLSLSLSLSFVRPVCRAPLGPSLLLIGQQTLNAKYDFFFFFFRRLFCRKVTRLLQFLFCFLFFCIPSSSSDAAPKIFHAQTFWLFFAAVCPSLGSFIHACTGCFTVGIGIEGHNIHQDDRFLYHQWMNMTYIYSKACQF